ncbi:MAG TPA: protein kinase, partial [Tepidisphaeraceae bacterium]|nr:protein kinase [Tepidisphaeraceae bacterium]
MGSETSAGGGGPVTRLAVLLFSDIVASTELKTKFGDVEYKRLLDRHNELFESSLGQISGARIIKHTGDGFLAELRTPSDAVRFALLFHSRMHLEPWQPVKLQTRIGIHQGEFTATIHAGQADVVGAAVDAAARIMSLAVGGQILLTQHVFNDARQFVRESPQALPGSPPLRWLSHGPYLFRGIDEPIRVCEVGIEGISPLSPPTSDKAKRVVPHDEEQTLGWRPAVGLDVPGRVSWKLESKLGEGGFGEVWLGQHEKLKERRVFKFCFDADRLRSLKREYTLFRLLREALGDREDIARLYEVKLDKPPFFLESEYTQGGNLLEWAARKRGIAAVPLAQRLDIVARICEAAGAAHSVGVLHKDIKPSNILIHEEANGAVLPRLSDFGIGMLGDRDSLRAHAITETGFTQLTQNSDSSRTGTRMYAPPESLLNRPFTTQGDVYALGVLLFQMAVADLGRPLAPGWERDIDDAVLRQDISKAVDGDPNQRLASAAELAGRVRTLDDRRQARVAQMQQAARALARARTRRLAGIAAVGILFIAIISIAAFLRERRQADEQAHLRALAESLQQSESAQHQHAQANLLRARKEIADMVAILEGKRASTDAATQPTTGVNPAGSPEDRPMSLRLADSIVANYLLFQKESADPEITESLAQAYISKAGIYFGTYTAKIEEHLQWSNEALTAANAGCIVLRRLIESDPARHDKYCGELADGLTEIAQFASDQNELERAYSEAVELRDDLAKSGKPADAIALVDLLVKGVRTDQEKTVAQKRLNHAIDLLRAIGATSESSEQRGRLALALARLAEINTDDSAARIGYLRSAADALMPAKAPMKFSDEELEMARLAITLQRDLAEALAAANQRVEALNCAARAAGIGDAIIKDHADWARSLILELASVQTSLAVLHATGN